MAFRKHKNEQPKETENRFRDPRALLRRIGLYFSTEPQKEKVLRHEDFQAAGDVYYAQVSAGYKVIQRLIWTVFIVFMILSILLNYRAITYDNFYYLIKDFSSAADTQGSVYETLSYESDDRQRFTLYRGGVASVSPSKISVFTATGRRTLNDTSAFSSPYIISSDRYMLVYDTSGKTFSLYNSFARIHNETLNYPVYDACFAEDGSFAVLTRESDSLAAIYVYDRSFDFAGGFTNNTYVFDLAMSRQRNMLSVLSYDLGEGIGDTVLTIKQLDTMETEKTLRFSGEFPLGCVFLEKNLFAVVTDTYIRIFDRNFECKTISRDYSSEELSAYFISEQGIAVATTRMSQTNVIAIDKNGEEAYNGSVLLNVADIAVQDNYLFLQTESGVARMAMKNGQLEILPCGQGRMLIYNQSTALVCGQSKAEYLTFGNR